MTPPPVLALLAAVRRRLWRDACVAAARRAGWASAALMLLATALHLAAGPVPVAAALAALALPWAAALAWAGRQRPDEPACALWADRHLGGASAFGTLVDAARTGAGAAQPAAVRWLVQWTAAQAPDAQLRLAQHRVPLRLARPLLSMLVCTALAVLVLALPDPATPPAPAVAASATAGPGGRPAASADTLGAEAAPALAGEIGRALQAAARPDDAAPAGSGGGSPAVGGGPAEDRPPAVAAPSGTLPGATARGDAPTARDTADATPVEAPPPTGAVQVAGAGSGREAGDSRDERADVGVSRALRGAIPMQRSETGARRPSADRQADSDRAAAVDEGPSTPGGAVGRAGAAPAAAPPPPATDAARLTPTESSYVQAWMKASAHTR